VATIDISMIVKAVNDASRNLRQVRDDVHGIGVSAEQTANRMRAIHVVMAGFATNKALQLGRAFLETASDVEQMRQRLTLTVGTVKQADDVIEDLSKRFQGTRLSAEAVTEAVIQFTQSGMDVDKAKQFANALGDVSLLSKDSEQAMKAASETFTKLLGKGEVDVRSLIGVIQKEMPLAIGFMAKEADVKIDQFVANVKSGMYEVDDLIGFFVKSVGNNLDGLRIMQQRTIGGAFKQLKDGWSDAIRTIQDTNIGVQIVDRMLAVRKAIDDFAQSLKDLDPNIVERFFAAVDNGVIIAGKLAAVLGPLAAGIARIAEEALRLLASLPAEALAIGLLAYFFLGRVGGFAVAAAITAATGAFGNLKVSTQDIVAIAEKYLQFGLIGLIVYGPAGAAATVGAVAAIDWLLGKIGDVAAASGKFSNGEDWKRYREAGATALDIVTAKVKVSWLAATQEVKKYAEEGVKGYEDMYAVREKLTDADVAGFKSAAAAREAFLRNAIKGAADTIPPFTQSAVEALDKLKTELTELHGAQGFAKLRADAVVYDEAVKRATNSTTLQAVELEKIAALTKNMSAGRLSGMTDQDQAKLKAFLADLNNSGEVLKATYEKAKNTLSGNTLGAAVSDIAKSHAEWNKQLDQNIKKVQDGIKEYGRYPAIVEELKKKEAALIQLKQNKGELEGKEIANAHTLDAILQRRLTLEQQMTQLRIQSQQLELKLQYSNDPMQALFSGTSGGQIFNQVLQQQIQLKQQMVSIDLQIANLETQRATASEAHKRQIDETIAKYRELHSATSTALQNLSAEAVAAKQLWQTIGQTIENGVVNAVTGLITRTMTLQQVGVQVFNALTQAAVKYLVQLMTIKAMSGGLFGGGGGGSLLGGIGSLFGFANGGVFQGGVKAFANGDIISGPTMFGLAGEAGTEAIMPLERIGGKLGVRATGVDGGGGVTINLTAIDTQSGVEFLMKNSQSIQGLLSARAGLNRGIKRVQI
jgi:hypothetical protein